MGGIVMEDNNPRNSLRKAILNIVNQQYEKCFKEIRLEIGNLIINQDIESFLKKFDFKLNIPKSKKAKVDFKIRTLIYSIIESNKLKRRVNRKFSKSISTVFAGVSNFNSEEFVFNELEKVVREIVIDELFYQVKKNEYVLENNIIFEKKENSKIKLMLLRMMKYIKCNYKILIFQFIETLILDIISNKITKSMNRRFENSCFYFGKNQGGITRWM
jgi:hypothetical protein